jgi:hypothetical protein
MTQEDLRKQVEIKQLELNALLEITQAINSNLPLQDLQLYAQVKSQDKEAGPVCAR